MKSNKVLMLVAALSLTGCFKLTQQAEQASTGTVSQQRDDDEIISNTKTLAIVGATNVLQHMKSITGVTTLTPAIQTKYAEKRDSFSVTGDIDTINAPMWMALTDLSGEFCNKLVTDESAAGGTKKFFTDVTFTAGPVAFSNNEAAFKGTTDKLATAFWGRMANDQEREILLTGFKDSFGADTGTNPRPALIWLCSAVLASRSATEL